MPYLHEIFRYSYFQHLSYLSKCSNLQFNDLSSLLNERPKGHRPSKYSKIFTKKPNFQINFQHRTPTASGKILTGFYSSNLPLSESKEKPGAYARKFAPENFEKSQIFMNFFFTSKAPGLLALIMMDIKSYTKFILNICEPFYDPILYILLIFGDFPSNLITKV